MNIMTLVVMSYEVRKYILNVHLSIHNFQKYSFSTFVIEVRGSPSTYISRGVEVCGRPLLFFCAPKTKATYVYYLTIKRPHH